ncbi:MAG: AraC family transcriptional regulator [Cyanobacteria bacterium P01_B01_bin.77]
MLKLTDANIEDLMDEAHQQGEQIYRTTEFGLHNRWLKQVGKGHHHLLKLRGGLTIYILEGRLYQHLKVKKYHDNTFPLTAKFYLSGASRIQTTNFPEIESDYIETTGHHYLYYLPELTEEEAWQADLPIKVVMIYADVDYFRMLGSIYGELPSPLRQLMHTTKRFHQPMGKMTLAMTQVLQQILHCPYRGPAGYLYLESKAQELLALQLAALDVDSTANTLSPFKAANLERVQYARDILVAKLSNPLSMMELSRQVGLNEQTLRQGFRYLFGTTVFGYLRDCRMEQAQQLLRQTDITIAQVAHQVGYRNPEAFSTAFRRQFSISPKAYQLGKRSQV